MSACRGFRFPTCHSIHCHLYPCTITEESLVKSCFVFFYLCVCVCDMCACCGTCVLYMFSVCVACVCCVCVMYVLCVAYFTVFNGKNVEAGAGLLNLWLNICLHKNSLKVSVKRARNPLPDLLTPSVEDSLEIQVSVSLSDDSNVVGE